MAKNTTDPKLAVAYLRVSLDEQELGPDAQRAMIETWAAKEGIQVVAWHVDEICSVTPLEERPGLSEALVALQQTHAGVLAVARRDRLSRDPVLTGMIERLVERGGARLMAANGAGNGDKAEDILMRRMVDAFAEYERALIRMRTKQAMAVKKARGEPVGCAAVGFTYSTVDVGTAQERKVLVPEPREQAMKAEARRLREEERLGLRTIALRLTAQGYRSRAGTPLDQTQVKRMLAA